MPKYVYRIVAAELWGNAKDDFDVNDWHVVASVQRYKPFTERWLLRVARECFQGRSFAWSENTSRPMSRDGITITPMQEVMWFLGRQPEDYEITGSCQIEYRGYYVGEIQELVENKAYTPKEQQPCEM